MFSGKMACQHFRFFGWASPTSRSTNRRQARHRLWPRSSLQMKISQQSDFAGVIFTKESMQGTFGLAEARIDDEHAPDVVMAFRWNDSKNQFGVPGMIDADWQRGAGKGTHATLSRFDMHNTLIAAGPDFRRGYTDGLPSGNVDLAPTILRILGITPSQPVDGRILSEAMVNKDAVVSKTET